GPHESGALARLDVLEFDDLLELIVDLQHEAVLEVAGVRHCLRISSVLGDRRHSTTVRSLLVRVSSSGPPSRTTSVSSIRTPPRPGKYTPGSTVTATPDSSVPVPALAIPGASWIRSPTPCPRPCTNSAPCPAASMTARAAASTSATGTPGRRASRPAACA